MRGSRDGNFSSLIGLAGTFGLMTTCGLTWAGCCCGLCTVIVVAVVDAPTVFTGFCCTVAPETCTVIVLGTASCIGDPICWAIAASCEPCRVIDLPSAVTRRMSCDGPMVAPDPGILATNAAILFTGAVLAWPTTVG